MTTPWPPLAELATQVRTGRVSSRELVAETAVALNLAARPEFNPGLSPPSRWRAAADAVLQPLRALVQSGRSAAPVDAAARAALTQAMVVQTLQSRIDVSAIGRSYVLSVKAEADDPALAAEIANKLTALYLARQRQDKVSATGQAEQFLDERIAELRR